MNDELLDLLTEIRDLLRAQQQLPPSSASSDKPPGEYLSIDQAATLSGLASVTLRRLVRSGTLAATNVGVGARRPTWRIRRQDLESYLSGQKRLTTSRHFRQR